MDGISSALAFEGRIDSIGICWGQELMLRAPVLWNEVVDRWAVALSTSQPFRSAWGERQRDAVNLLVESEEQKHLRDSLLHHCRWL